MLIFCAPGYNNIWIYLFISCVLQNVKSSGNYTWRIDLCKTEKHWPGWFQGLSKKFLSIHAQKLLLLANIDRMDKDLTVGQMQGNIIWLCINTINWSLHLVEVNLMHLFVLFRNINEKFGFIFHD